MATRALHVDGTKVVVRNGALALDGRRLSSLAFLHEAADVVETLSLTDCGLTSLRTLPKLPKLKELVVTRNALANLDGIENAKHLERLDFDAKKLKNTAALSSLKKLAVLGVGVWGGDLRFLAGAHRVGYIAIVGPLTSLSGVEKLTGLGELIVHGAQLKSPVSIKHPRLWKLFLQQCALTSVPVLKTPKLLIFYAHKNRISDTSNLRDLPALRDVHLGNNAIAHLSGCTGLPKLEYLTLDAPRLKSVDAATDAALSKNAKVRVGRRAWPPKKLVVVP